MKAFYRFIGSYLTESHRWSSPLFLLGESYGTFRAAELANVLAENGVPLNCVPLLEAPAFHTTSERRRWSGSRAETFIGRHGRHEAFSDIEEFYMKKILIEYAVFRPGLSKDNNGKLG
jgi:hypothetical protein